MVPASRYVTWLLQKDKDNHDFGKKIIISAGKSR